MVNKQRVVEVCFVAACLAAGVVFVYQAWRVGRENRAADRPERVMSAVKFALANFKDIDTDGDELLSEGELQAAESRLPLLHHGPEHMALLRAEIRQVGHIAKSNSSVGPVFYLNSRGGMGVGAGQTSVNTYCIDARDLRHYTPSPN